MQQPLSLFAVLMLISCVLAHRESAAGSAKHALPGLDGRIKHVIVLMEENRAFDHLLGWRPGVNGLTGHEFNPTFNRSRDIFVQRNASFIAACDPNHGTPETTQKIFGYRHWKDLNHSDPCMCGFVETEEILGNANTSYCGVMDMFTPQDLPIINALADNFVLMDRFFAAVPGPTWPNRMFFMSGTSGGSTETGPWYHNHLGSLFPQKTFFKQVEEAGGNWKVYYNDTPWELFMEDLAHTPERIENLEAFFDDARSGTLPDFAFINPRSGINMTLGVGSSDQHPDHDVSVGEEYYKSVYEALRAGPQWNETLFVLTYDEHGGFYDHVAPPMHDIPPPGDGEKSYPDPFRFDRLGLRIPTLLISPWVPKGVVLSGPPAAQKPTPSSEYDLTSIMASTRKILPLLNGTPALTDRDAWSATFEHVLTVLDSPRTDCPMHLPAPIPPQKGYLKVEAELPLNSLQTHISTVHAHLAGVPYPNHITRQKDVSNWLQTHFAKHKATTAAWKASKQSPPYDVHLIPKYTPNVTAGWHINRDTAVAFETVSAQVDGKDEWCLDAGPNPAKFSEVTVSLCYPSRKPSHNRDTSQHWVFADDASFRPFAAQDLCVTNRQFSGSPRLHLMPCDDSLQQHYAYEGTAPGHPWDGWIYYSYFTSVFALVPRS
jgi:phospholipase C